MKNFYILSIIAVSLLLVGTVTMYIFNNEPDSALMQLEEKEKAGFLGRTEYFHQMLKDPATGKIPRGIRSLELNHAEFLPTTDDFKGKRVTDFAFTEVGPNDVGGRTRALAVDVSNSNVIVAGGVSGGIWKSTDGGQSWSLKTATDQHPSVTSLAQDPRPGNTNIWYYSTGEFTGNSADASNGSAFFNGKGIYKSTDNAETWSMLPSTDVGALNDFDTPYDYVSRIIVNPTTGSVFLASHYFGLYRSTDGENFTPNFAPSDHSWLDIAAAPDGTLYATLSDDQNDATNTPGLYRSTDDGDTWNHVSEAVLPAGFGRTTLAVSPSNSDIVYVFYALLNNSTGQHEAGIYYADISNPGNNQDRTANIPDYGEPVGNLDLQGQYNMVSIVKPNDPDHLVVGGTNAFRSTDGFASSPSENVGWVGGYSSVNNISSYDEHHPDQHIMFYDPNDPSRLFSGHDGGVSVAENADQVPLVWTDLNNGYNVTQFYHISIHPGAGDDRILGGTQDNGTPFFRFNTVGESSASIDVSTGDGSFGALRYTFGVVSSQNGVVFKWDYVENGDLQDQDGNGTFTRLDPQACVSSSDPSVGERKFIHPFIVDYNDENVMYFPCKDRLYRNTNISAVPDFDQEPATEEWEQVSDFSLDGREISSIQVSQSNPTDVLYVAGSEIGLTPVIKRLDNATVGTGGVDISIPAIPADSYINDIAVNPKNGSEIMAVVSNYGVVSVYYSDDAGANWSEVEGNLATISPDQEGPSVRAAAIGEVDAQNKKYFLGTSTGLYSTTNLDGDNTVWLREASDVLGLSVVSSLEYRSSDNILAVGTHGRGIFIGGMSQAVSTETGATPTAFSLDQNYPNPFNPSTQINYSLPQSAEVRLEVINSLGQRVALLVDQSQSAGSYSVSFDASNLSSGMYFYSIQAGSFQQTRKMLLIK